MTEGGDPMTLTTRPPSRPAMQDGPEGPTMPVVTAPQSLDVAERTAFATSGERTGMRFADDDVVFELDGLSCFYGDFQVIREVTFQIPKQAITAIIGPSGSGKSTLLHCLAGLDSLTSGAVYIGETYLAALDDKTLTELRRTQVGFVFQAYNLIPTLTARENINLPMMLGGDKGDPAWVDQVIDTVGLRDRLEHRPSELSGGQQQRVAVARALASRPTIIFADEPTGNLDSRTGAEILEFMQQAVREYGQTIVMVTHDPVAASYADRVVFLADGRIVDEMSEPTADRVLDRLKRFGD
jgi:putative ABC transport system ATP-binding protein